VAETFNDFFVNVAKDIGKDSCAVNQEHPSVKVISEHSYSENKLKFESIAFSIVLFISIVIGLLTIGFAIFKFLQQCHLCQWLC
jgi:hypothetical protein